MVGNTNKEVHLRIPRKEAQLKLQSQIDEGEQIIKQPIADERQLKLADEAMTSWYDYTRDMLLKIFSTDRMQQEFVWSVRAFGLHLTFQQRVQELREHLNARINTLRSIVRRMDLYEEDIPAVAKSTKPEVESSNKKNVFVVHGRNEQLRKSIFDFLRAISLNPLEWSQALAATEKASPYIGEILDAAFKQAYAVVVLLTGDDKARLREEFLQERDTDEERKLTPQPRANVLFEAGMAMGYKQDRTVLVQVGRFRQWSDIAGRYITYLDNSPEKRYELATKLQTIGCDVDLGGQDWLKQGDFRDSLSKDETTTTQEFNSTIGSDDFKKRTVSRQLNDLLSRVIEALRNSDPVLELDFRIEYAKLLQIACALWLFDKRRIDQLLLLKAEASRFDIGRVTRGDKLGSLKWVANSVKKMLLILEE